MKNKRLNMLAAMMMLLFVSSAALAQYGSVEKITAANLKNHLTFIAADAMEGRDTGSRGLKTAANYIAAHLERWGVKPAGDEGSYFQKITLLKHTVDLDQTSVKINDQTFTFGDDYLAQPATASASGKMVYVSHGWVIKDKNINPYEGIDVKGKIMVVSESLPPGMSFRDLRGAGEIVRPDQYGREHGALGAIIIPGGRSLGRWERNRERATETGVIEVEKFKSEEEAEELPIITAAENLVKVLFEDEKHNAEAVLAAANGGDEVPAFELGAEKTASLNIVSSTENGYTQNVVGIVEGKDSKLKNEYVAIGAHYDHVGIGRAIDGDDLYNGADDDGSGTVSVLNIAEAFATGAKPKRSILFVWHTGEEKGLWGSRYFNEFPTVPHEQIVAQLNIDMVGRSRAEGDTNPANDELAGPNEVYVIGSKMMSTELGELSEKVNNSYLKLDFNYKYDDPNDPQRFFYRSDHFNYARHGIPIIFYFTGVHEDYHRPSDTVDKIDFVKMEKIARTIYATGWELANRNKRPEVDKPLPQQLSGR